MARFLFWNVYKKDLTTQIVRLCHDYDVDVLILAERGEVQDFHIEECLNKGQTRRYFQVTPAFDKISFFHRYLEKSFTPLFIEPQKISKMSVPNIRLSPPIGQDILIIALHLPSKMYRNEPTQAYIAGQIMDEIKFYESSLSHTRTLVVGDMNMNPFESGMAAFDCFHALMDKRKTLENERTSPTGEKSQFFYNPMWRLMGNSVQGPPGTYYYNKTDTVEFFWHTFDQVLVRPSLVPFFNEDSLKIIDSVNGTSLIDSKGRPDKKRFSDHLPLFFEIDIEKIEEGANHGKEKSLGGRRRNF